MNSRKNKDLISSTLQKKPKSSYILNKPIQKVLKDYNSCFHQKSFSIKEFPLGKTTFTTSINMRDYPKTLRAYHSKDSLSKYDIPTAAASEKTNESFDHVSGKAKKLKCEGFCGKVFNRSYLKSFAEDGLCRILCPECIEQIMSKLS